MRSRRQILAALAGAAAGRAAQQESGTLAERMERTCGHLVGPGEPGLAVMVRRGGRTEFARAWGVRDLREHAPIGTRTNFRLASCTKQFTAMAVMLLVRDGKLSYTQEWAPGITVRHLLTHTAGLPDYEDLMEAEGASKWSTAHQIQDGEVIELLRGAKTRKFAAGTSWSYSNSGYVVLGTMAAEAARMPFAEVLERRIFAPLGMTRTRVLVAEGAAVEERAYGHSRREGRLVETDQSSTSATQGDGGVYSNLEDLAKWDAALDAGTLLPAAAMALATTPVRLNDGSRPRWPKEPGEDNLAPGREVEYGFGWFLDGQAGRRRMWHFGSTSGFRTAIMRWPEERLSAIVLSNRTDLDPTVVAAQVR